MNKKVFIAQPFDREKYDQRYDEVYAPAIRTAGFEPYRVDRDPTVSIPIEEIERNIRESFAVFSDISEDNPNVWFEFGYAIAAGKELCFICSRERTSREQKFPFDMQHRSITIYDNNSRGDWDKLETAIVSRLEGIKERLEKNAEIERAISERKMEPGSKVSSFSDRELEALAIIATAVPINEGISEYLYNERMDKKGYTGIALNLAIRKLAKQELVERFENIDYDGDRFPAYRLTESCWDFMETNLGVFALRKEKTIGLGIKLEDDIPF